MSILYLPCHSGEILVLAMPSAEKGDIWMPLLLLVLLLRGQSPHTGSFLDFGSHLRMSINLRTKLHSPIFLRTKWGNNSVFTLTSTHPFHSVACWVFFLHLVLKHRFPLVFTMGLPQPQKALSPSPAASPQASHQWLYCPRHCKSEQTVGLSLLGTQVTRKWVRAYVANFSGKQYAMTWWISYVQVSLSFF